LSDYKQPGSLAIERLISLVKSDKSLEQPVKEAFVEDILSAASSDLDTLRKILSDTEETTNDNAN